MGSALVDILLYIDKVPSRGGDILADRQYMTTGAGFNMLAGASRLGLATAYGGLVGCGPFGQQVTRDLAIAGVEVLLTPADDQDTGFSVCLVEPDGERTFISSPGVDARLQSRHLEDLKLTVGDAICVSGYDLRYPVSGQSLGQWLPHLSSDQLLVLDPGELVAEIPPQRLLDVLRRTDVLSANASESTSLTGIGDPAEAAKDLTRRIAIGGWVIVRVGAEGCWVATVGQTPIHVDPRPAKVVDTTGAGDTHVAVLIARLAADDPVAVAAQWANVAASMSVERLGGSAGPEPRELAAAVQLAGIPTSEAAGSSPGPSRSMRLA